MEVFRVEFFTAEGVNIPLPVKDFQSHKEVANFTESFSYRSWSLWEVTLRDGTKIIVKAVEAAKWYRDDVQDSYGWSWHDIYIDKDGKELYNRMRGDHTLSMPDAVGKDTGILIAIDRLPINKD